MTPLPIDPSTAPTPASIRKNGRRLALAWSATSAMSNKPAMLRLAFASDDRATVNQHFGAAVGFAIHAFDGERWQLVELAEFPPETMDGNENKLLAKIAALAGCAAVYCLAAGLGGQQLLAGIQPVLSTTAPIDARGRSAAIRTTAFLGGQARAGRRARASSAYYEAWEE